MSDTFKRGDLFRTILWYCPKTNLLFCVKHDLMGFNAYYPKGISIIKLTRPEERGCIRVGEV